MPAMVDMGQLASLLMQARGPLLDRVTRQIAKFNGDGSVDVTEWLAAVERVCGLEDVKPASVIGFLLDGEPARLFRRLSVADAEDWKAVKKALMDGYASPMPAVYREWHSLSLREGESVDAYVDRLERLAGRLRVEFGSTFFRSKFYDGLPRHLYEWAVAKEGAYEDDSAVDRMVSDIEVTQMYFSENDNILRHTSHGIVFVVLVSHNRPCLQN